MDKNMVDLIIIPEGYEKYLITDRQGNIYLEKGPVSNHIRQNSLATLSFYTLTTLHQHRAHREIQEWLNININNLKSIGNRTDKI